MCSEKNHRDYYTITTYKANTFKDEIKRKSLRDIFVYHFVFYICLFVAEIFFYFKGRNSCREKVSPFSPILDKFAKVWPAKNIFVNISKRLSHEKWTSKAKLDENWNKLTWTCLKVITFYHLQILQASQQTLVGLEDILKTSWTRLQCNNILASKTSWRRLAKKTSWRHLARRLGRRKIFMLKTSSRHLEGMSWRRLDDMSWRRTEGMSWRHFEDVLETKKRWGYLYLTNLNVYKSNISIFHKSVSDKSKPNPKS